MLVHKGLEILQTGPTFTPECLRTARGAWSSVHSSASNSACLPKTSPYCFFCSEHKQPNVLIPSQLSRLSPYSPGITSSAPPSPEQSTVSAPLETQLSGNAHPSTRSSPPGGASVLLSEELPLF